MSDHQSGFRPALAPSAAPVADTATATGAEVLLRRVSRENRQLATLRCVEHGGQWLVACDVYPLDTMRVEPLRLGPHAFATRQEAERFVDEALRAFEYLGCDLS